MIAVNVYGCGRVDCIDMHEDRGGGDSVHEAGSDAGGTGQVQGGREVRHSSISV